MKKVSLAFKVEYLNANKVLIDTEYIFKTIQALDDTYLGIKTHGEKASIEARCESPSNIESFKKAHEGRVPTYINCTLVSHSVMIN